MARTTGKPAVEQPGAKNDGGAKGGSGRRQPALLGKAAGRPDQAGVGGIV